MNKFKIGNFKDYTATIEFKPGKNGALAAQAAIEVDSIDTGIEARDKLVGKEVTLKIALEATAKKTK